MELSFLHEELYSMLKIVNEICEKENICYFMDGGSALGAVREHDFIAWDDDIDIIVKRKDYKRLKKTMKSNLPVGYRFIEPQDFAPYFFDFIPRIINEKIFLREENEEDRALKNYQNRPAIDICILDNAPDSKLMQKLCLIKNKFIYGMAMSKRYINHKEKYSLSEKIMSGACITIGKIFSFNQMINIFNKNARRYNKRKSLFYMVYNVPAYYMDLNKTILKKEDYESAKMMKFRDIYVPVPIGYDDILTQLYGDYMTPVHDDNIYNKHT